MKMHGLAVANAWHLQDIACPVSNDWTGVLET